MKICRQLKIISLFFRSDELQILMLWIIIHCWSPFLEHWLEGRESLWIYSLGKWINLIKNKILSCKFRNWLFFNKNCWFASVLSIWKECSRRKPGNFPSREWKSLLPPLLFLNCADEAWWTSTQQPETSYSSITWAELKHFTCLCFLEALLEQAREETSFHFPLPEALVFFPSNHTALLLIGYGPVGIKLIKSTKHIPQRQAELSSYFWTHNRAIDFPGGKKSCYKARWLDASSSDVCVARS